MKNRDPRSNQFWKFRRATVGNEIFIQTPYGSIPLIYLDWTASGRSYRLIERVMLEKYGPLVGNTHTQATATGKAMTDAYHEAREKIKRHVGAGKDDILIAEGSGMTGAVAKLQRMLGLSVPYKFRELAINSLAAQDRPVVFITEMEHHSNDTSWVETIAEVVKIPQTQQGIPSLPKLRKLLRKYEARNLKIGSFTACSNVTGIVTPIHEMAAIMHEHGGLCFADYAASAPYVRINMHPKDSKQALDAVMFSPHKFLGGPGTPGILVINSALITSPSPDRVGGGTVLWTNPWGGRAYLDNVEDREDGGTPPFLQLIRAGLAIQLKEEMDIKRIAHRKERLLKALYRELDSVPGLNILAGKIRDRQAIVSFTMKDIHYGLVVRLLNDRFGIQTRGGCSCAGTYGHSLFGIDRNTSKHICDLIDSGDSSEKPGWIRISLHPTNTFEEISFAGNALRTIAENFAEWSQDYQYDPRTNEYTYIG